MGEFDIPIIAGAAAIGISLLCVGAHPLQILPDIHSPFWSTRLAIWLMTLWWERRRVKQNGIQIEMGSLDSTASQNSPRTSKCIIYLRVCLFVSHQVGRKSSHYRNKTDSPTNHWFFLCHTDVSINLCPFHILALRHRTSRPVDMHRFSMATAVPRYRRRFGGIAIASGQDGQYGTACPPGYLRLCPWGIGAQHRWTLKKSEGEAQGREISLDP